MLALARAVWRQVLSLVVACSAMIAYGDAPVWIADEAYATDAGLNLVEPAQFQRGGERRTAASPVTMAGSGQRIPQSFNVQLARAPKLMGDFFGLPLADSKLEAFIGRSVEHASGGNHFHIIDEEGQIVYAGGPAGSKPGSKFIRTGVTPSPSAPKVEGLASDIPGEFVAVRIPDFVTVFNASGDTLPDQVSAQVWNINQVLGSDEIPAISPADIVGRVRLQENNSALPQDRVFFDYNFFHNVPLTANDLNVNRFSPGLEKTFFDGQSSLEIRVPMGVSLNSTVVTDAPFDTSNTEMGNLVVAPKVLLYADGTRAVAVGCGIAVPTADDITVAMSNGNRLLTVENEAVHLLPYVAYLHAPSGSKLFAHAFLAGDFDTNGNTTSADLGSGLEEIGTWNDQHLISAHLGVGAWAFQNYSPNVRFNGLAGTCELHYTNTLNDADSLVSPSYTLGNSDTELSLANATIGAHARFGLTTFTLGFCTPLTEDKVFDGELRCFVNRLF
jgi:hypothetical protein